MEVHADTPPNASARRTYPFGDVDADAFVAELKALRAELDASLGEEDLAHLRRIERIGRACTALGVATCWIAPNPASAVLLSVGRSTRWLLMHHIGHRGYDRVPGVPARYTSRAFAKGARRWVDWFDWMLPDAWIYEHNILHHFHTGEERDPDLIERNAESLQKGPMAARYAQLAGLALTWRASYYAPKTLRVWLERHADTPAPEGTVLRTLVTRCLAPYASLHFAAMPAAFLLLAGPWAGASAFANSLAAEALTNLHTFVVVGPNHTGDDLYRFADRPGTRADFYVRQVIGSVNYATGTEALDFAQLWLNYQIEHHLWPDVPMLKYRQFQPRIKALCEKHGIPYVQQSVWSRVRKMTDVAVGRTAMKRA